MSSPAASSDLYGTQTIGSYGKVRSLKAVSFEHLNYEICLCVVFSTRSFLNFGQVGVLQMLEKQMGPDSFRKVFTSLIPLFALLLIFMYMTGAL